VPLAKLEDLVFGAWDIFPDSGVRSCNATPVCSKRICSRRFVFPLQKIKPMKAVFDQSYVKRCKARTLGRRHKMALAEQLIEEIANLEKEKKVRRVVMIWGRLYEILLKQHAVYKNLDTFEKACAKTTSDRAFVIYCLRRAHCPEFLSPTAPLSDVDVPASSLAENKSVANLRESFKTGQTP